MKILMVIKEFLISSIFHIRWQEIKYLINGKCINKQHHSQKFLRLPETTLQAQMQTSTREIMDHFKI